MSNTEQPKPEAVTTPAPAEENQTPSLEQVFMMLGEKINTAISQVAETGNTGMMRLQAADLDGTLHPIVVTISRISPPKQPNLGIVSPK